MNIIGYSGFHKAVAFKRKNFPNLEERDYHIATSHDAAAALVTDSGVVAAAAEERFARRKATAEFPIQAMEYCLKQAGLTWGLIDHVVHSFAYEPVRDGFMKLSDFERTRFEEVYSDTAQLEAVRAYLPPEMQSKFLSVTHHVAHAASAFYVSGMEESLILVSDGIGELHSATMAIGRGDDIEILRTVPSLHSLGILYSVITHHLGFVMCSDEYKIMGLAPYGNARSTLNKFMELIQLQPDGTYRIPCLLESGRDQDQETLSQSRARIAEIFGPARVPGEKMKPEHLDMAAGMQAALQVAMLHIVRHFRKETGLRSLCLAGGVALNCVVNGAILKSGLFKEVFVQPAAGDDGSAIGAALYVQRKHRPGIRYKRMAPPFLGPEFSQQEIRTALEATQGVTHTEYPEREALLKTTAQAIRNGEIIGWFQQRMEFGPRALGARSILADPTVADMRYRVNALVKKRESFRPFAPAVTKARASEIFDVQPEQSGLFENMLFVTQVKEAYREKLPAVTHVDGSARVQVVGQDNNSLFHDLISTFGELSGIPVVLNTSFNVAGQPIVCTPREAIDTFLKAGLAKLVIGNFVVTCS